MKIDLTAAARIVPLNCADVGRARIAKHIRPADGGIAAGFAKGGDQRSANGKQALNQYVPKLQCLQKRKLHLFRPPSSNPPPAWGGCYRPRRTMLWQRVLATTAAGPLAPSRRRRRRHFPHDAAAGCSIIICIVAED